MKRTKKSFALCVDNTDYKVSLIPGKVYRIIPDAKAAKDDLVRIIDESGEDYLYHKSHFLFVDFPPGVAKRIRALEQAG
jgi:MinD-like ATPase involved in chromosome partitioning or flagellar assembly